MDLLRPVCEKLGRRATLHAVDTADHGYKILKRSRRARRTSSSRWPASSATGRRGWGDEHRPKEIARLAHHGAWSKPVKKKECWFWGEDGRRMVIGAGGPHGGDRQRWPSVSGANGSDGNSRSIISSRKSSRDRSGSRASSVRETLAAAVAHRDGLAEQRHRGIGLGDGLGGRDARAGPAGQARQRGVAQAVSNHSSARPRWQALPKRNGPAGVGRGAGEVAQVAAGQAAAAEAIGQVASGTAGSSGPPGPALLDGDRPVAAVAGLGRPAERAEHVGEVVVDIGEADAELGDGGVVGGQLLADLQRPAVLGLRLRRLARLRQQDAEVVVAVRQAAAEFGDGGVVGGQLLVDRQRPAVLGLRLRRLARLLQQDAEVAVADRQAAAELGDGGVVGGQLLRRSPAPGGTRPPPPPACPSPPAGCRGCCGCTPGCCGIR